MYSAVPCHHVGAFGGECLGSRAPQRTRADPAPACQRRAGGNPLLVPAWRQLHQRPAGKRSRRCHCGPSHGALRYKRMSCFSKVPVRFDITAMLRLRTQLSPYTLFWAAGMACMSRCHPPQRSSSTSCRSNHFKLCILTTTLLIHCQSSYLGGSFAPQVDLQIQSTKSTAAIARNVAAMAATAVEAALAKVRAAAATYLWNEAQACPLFKGSRNGAKTEATQMPVSPRMPLH